MTKSDPWPVAVTVQVPYDEHVAAKRTDVFVQWKGTDVCFDFTCECGFSGHFDGYFAYTIKCRSCGTVWEMPATIYPRKVTPGDGSYPRDEMHVVPGEDDESGAGRTEVNKQETEAHLAPYRYKSMEDFAIHMFQLHNMDKDRAYNSDRETLTRIHWTAHGAHLTEMLHRWPWVGIADVDEPEGRAT